MTTWLSAWFTGLPWVAHIGQNGGHNGSVSFIKIPCLMCTSTFWSKGLGPSQNWLKKGDVIAMGMDTPISWLRKNSSPSTCRGNTSDLTRCSGWGGQQLLLPRPFSWPFDLLLVHHPHLRAMKTEKLLLTWLAPYCSVVPDAIKSSLSCNSSQICTNINMDTAWLHSDWYTSVCFSWCPRFPWVSPV